MKTKVKETTKQRNLRIMRELKQTIKKSDQKFKREVKRNRPTLNSDVELKSVNLVARKTSKQMAKLALKLVALQSAINYANAMLAQDILGDGADLPAPLIMALGQKMLTIKMIRLVGDHLQMPANEIEMMVNNIIAREFPAQRNSDNKSNFNQHPVAQALADYSKKLPANPNPYGNTAKPTVFKRRGKPIKEDK